MPEGRYLLGRGEVLMKSVGAPGGGNDKKPPYSEEHARDRLLPMLDTMMQQIKQLPDAACPDDETVAIVTLHPQWISKSDHPGTLLSEANLRPVGSKPSTVTPEAWTRQTEPQESPTTELFVAGKREAFEGLHNNLLRGSFRGSDQLARIEQIRIADPTERVRALPDQEFLRLEAVLHARADWEYIWHGFEEYLESFGGAPDVGRRRFVEGLCFMPIALRREHIAELGLFSFLRVARPIPTLRTFRNDAVPHAVRFPYELPTEPAIDQKARVAIFDCGLPPNHVLTPWVRSFVAPGVGTAAPRHARHGLAVTSAFLFGPIVKGQPLPRPFANADHWQVVDENSYDANGEYIDVMDRIENILSTRPYDFVNLSIGPSIPIDDGDVNYWTAKLDQYAANGTAIIACAVGNEGDADRESGLARIQAPADGVNVLGIGAAHDTEDGWSRAPYSCLGPGRSPGFIKPDVVLFGGSDANPFWTAGNASKLVEPIFGTSFASPYGLRAAVGVRAHMGDDLIALAIRALMVHHAEADGHDESEVGFGRVPTDLADLLQCRDGEVTVVYQHTLQPGQYMRAEIPMPAAAKGNVELKATLCYSTGVEPENPFAYTRAGLEVMFRPHRDRFDPKGKGTVAKTAPFIESFAGSEAVLRRDAHKWETTIKGTDTKRATSLLQPSFDIHYNAREGGANAKKARAIPFALVVSVRIKSMPNLYDQIVARYSQLVPLRPIVQVPVRVSTRHTA